MKKRKNAWDRLSEALPLGPRAMGADDDVSDGVPRAIGGRVVKPPVVGSPVRIGQTPRNVGGMNRMPPQMNRQQQRPMMQQRPMLGRQDPADDPNAPLPDLPLEDFDWDLSDTDAQPAQQGRRSPPPIPVKASKPAGPPKFTPGVSQGPRAKYPRPQVGRRTEATDGAPRRRPPEAPVGPSLAQRQRSKTLPIPITGVDPSVPQPIRPQGQPWQPPVNPNQPQVRRRNPRDTDQMVNPNMPINRGVKAPAPPTGEKNWHVEIPGDAVYSVPAKDENEAKQRIASWLGDQGTKVDPNSLKVGPAPRDVDLEKEGITGYQMPIGAKERLKEIIRLQVQEIVRVKPGGGGYQVFPPNKGKKKKDNKPVGEFPTRLAAKRAELARFPPKDPEQLKKLRARLDKLSKDPEKRAKAEHPDLSKSKKSKKSGKPAGARKKAARESIIDKMAASLTERLFREDEIAGSPWDEKLGNLQPDAIANDKRLAALHKAMQKGSTSALLDAHKGLSKLMRGIASVNAGDITHDEVRKKMYVPINLMFDDENEIGPIHFYVDGGHVKCEISPDARQLISELEPELAREVRGCLMSYQEDHLPKIDHARKPWSDRDSYLDKLHAKLDKHVGGMSPIEIHLAKQLLNKNRRK